MGTPARSTIHHWCCMTTQSEIYTALVAGKTIKRNVSGQPIFLALSAGGQLVASSSLNLANWAHYVETFSHPEDWEIVEAPEVYTAECDWFCSDFGPVYPDSGSAFNYGVLKGKRTKLTIEVLK